EPGPKAEGGGRQAGPGCLTPMDAVTILASCCQRCCWGDPTMEPRKETQVRSFSVVWTMLAGFVFSAGLPMCTVKEAPQSPWQRAECSQGLCSPYGYTISLALFIVPILAY